MVNNIVLRIFGKFLIPFTLLFALYVQFHGDFRLGVGLAELFLGGKGLNYAVLDPTAGHGQHRGILWVAGAWPPRSVAWC